MGFLHGLRLHTLDHGATEFLLLLSFLARQFLHNLPSILAAIWFLQDGELHILPLMLGLALDPGTCSLISFSKQLLHKSSLLASGSTCVQSLDAQRLRSSYRESVNTAGFEFGPTWQCTTET